MNDQPNLQQFVDEISSFSDEAAPAAGAASPMPTLPAIGQVLEIAGSGSRVAWMRRRARRARRHIRDPSVAMSGQVGSQVKMAVGNSWLIANVRTLRAGDERRRSSPTSTSSAKATAMPTGGMTNFRRGVTRYPIPGADGPAGHDRGPALDLRRRRQPAHRDRHRLSDRRHPRRALRRPDAVEAFRGPGIDRYR